MTWNAKTHARARELCERATPGPWTAEKFGDESVPWFIYAYGGDVLVCEWANEEEAGFIAESRTLLPAALDRIERLERALEDARSRHTARCVSARSADREFGGCTCGADHRNAAIDRALAGEDDE